MKPILFNTEMVRAILEGRKTVTRRVNKDGNKYTIPLSEFIDFDRGTYAVKGINEDCEQQYLVERELPYKPGDILYVRETWCEFPKKEYHYKSDYGTEIDDAFFQAVTDVKWRPSIHMPKEVARIFLKVTGIRAEQLHNITNDEAKAEGIWGLDPYTYQNSEFYNTVNPDNYWIATFAGLWNSTVKKPDIPLYGWEANPWVWVIEFERCEKPEAQP